MTRAQRRLAQLERWLSIELMMAEIAAEYGIRPEEILDEAQEVLAYHDRYGHYPPDVEATMQVYEQFYAQHGRPPTIEEWGTLEGA
jgi:hypothetical protein